ncbi:hypothetical protein EDD11_003382 [Mortierella claussenii]|nr:hypothetical protein EDD11_003382 [Mortierella claussenii]
MATRIPSYLPLRRRLLSLIHILVQDLPKVESIVTPKETTGQSFVQRQINSHEIYPLEVVKARAPPSQADWPRRQPME